MVMFILLYKAVLNFSVCGFGEILKCDDFYESYSFPVVLLTILYKVIITF